MGNVTDKLDNTQEEVDDLIFTFTVCLTTL
jgi:hypothetical protein